MRKDEITPREKTKSRNPPHEKSKFQHEKTKKRHAKIGHLKLSICRLFEWGFSSFRHFACRYFVFSRGVFLSFRVSLFRFFAWRLFAWRLFVFSRVVISSFRVASFRLFAWRLFVFSRGVFFFFFFRLFTLFRLFVISSFRLYCLTDIAA